MIVGHSLILVALINRFPPAFIAAQCDVVFLEKHSLGSNSTEPSMLSLKEQQPYETLLSPVVFNCRPCAIALPPQSRAPALRPILFILPQPALHLRLACEKIHYHCQTSAKSRKITLKRDLAYCLQALKGHKMARFRYYLLLYGS